MSGAGQKTGVGQQTPADAMSPFNTHAFQIEQALSSVRTTILVKVVAVEGGAGALAKAGTVDVLPLVNDLDGAGNASKHITVFTIPYNRMQGGKNAIILDPEVGDVGWAAIADRDISAAKNSAGQQANPGSYRRFSFADSIYIGGILNAVPEQYVQFNSDGITIADNNGNKIEMNSDGIKLTDSSGNELATGSGGLTYNDVDIGDDHTHSGVQSGTDDTGPPT